MQTSKGIYEYLLGGKTDPQLLDVRLFDEKTKVAAYEQQTQKAEGDGRLQLPAVRDRRQRQQDAHLQAGRDGR